MNRKVLMIPFVLGSVFAVLFGSATWVDAIQCAGSAGAALLAHWMMAE